MLETLAQEVYLIAEKAGLAIVQALGQNPKIKISYKSDNSVLTDLDLLANNIIIQALSNISTYPILSEEQKIPNAQERAHWPYYWCIDPLDGTKDLIEGTGEYTVNIALIKNHEPILGVVYVPEQAMGFLGTQGGGAYKITAEHHQVQIHTRKRNENQWAVLMSRFHTDTKLYQKITSLAGASIKKMGSSLKLCSIALGEFDCYPRLVATHEWDLAAAQVILEAAGGAIFDLNFNNLTYNDKKSLIQPPFIAVGDLSSNWQTLSDLMHST